MEEQILHKPTSKQERILLIDIIRGFALFGVFWVNTVMFNATMFGFSSSPAANPWVYKTQFALFDFIPALLVQIFGEGKFYTIFSFLFGLGFYLFITRAEQKGLVGKKLFVRRLMFLLLFGLLHFTLVWYGDILHTYAIVGFVMVLFAKSKPQVLFKWALAFFVLYLVVILGFTFLSEFDQGPVSSTEATSSFSMQSLEAAQTRVYTQGQFKEILTFRVAVEFLLVLTNSIIFGTKILAMFLLGFAFGKIKFFDNLEVHAPLMGKVFWWVLALSIVGTLGFVGLQAGLLGNFFGKEALELAFNEITIVAMSTLYVISLTLLFLRGKGGTLFKYFAAVGQMALTNYLVQCTVLSLIFYSHGLGLMHKISLSQCLLITLFIYTIQMIYSPLWLKHFTYGPFEWIWRKLTYKNV